MLRIAEKIPTAATFSLTTSIDYVPFLYSTERGIEVLTEQHEDAVLDSKARHAEVKKLLTSSA